MRFLDSRATINAMNIKLEDTGLRASSNDGKYILYRNGEELVSYYSKFELIEFINRRIDHIKVGSKFESMLKLNCLAYTNSYKCEKVRGLMARGYNGLQDVLIVNPGDMKFRSREIRIFDGLAWYFYYMYDTKIPKMEYFKMPKYELVTKGYRYYGFREGKVDLRELERLHVRQNCT